MIRAPVKPLLVVELFELAPGLLDGERIDRIALLQVGFLLQRLLADLVAADEQHVLQQRPLQHVEDHDPAAGHLLPVGLHVDEHVGVVEPADVFLDQFQVEGPAGPGADVRQNFVQRQRLVAADLHVHDLVGAAKRRPATRPAADRPARRRRPRGGGTAKPLSPHRRGKTRQDRHAQRQRNSRKRQCDGQQPYRLGDRPSLALSVLVRFAREEKSEESRKPWSGTGCPENDYAAEDVLVLVWAA